MFDFMDSDWFVIGLEIVFLIFIIYDIRRYMQTKKREYIVNIVMTLGFGIWVLYPYYKSYFGWEESQKSAVLSTCSSNDTNATSLCICTNETIFKTYIYDEYKSVDKNSTEFVEFLKETRDGCLDDGWF